MTSNYDSGFKAFREGRCISTNPFQRGSNPYSLENPWFQWRRGFFNAKEELFDNILILEENIRADMFALYTLKKKSFGNSNGIQS